MSEIDVSLTLDYLVNGAEFEGSLTDNTQDSYDAIKWLDTRGKPTWSDIETTGSILRDAQIVIDEISNLEKQITPRRQRDYDFGEDGGWLQSKHEEIKALREQLV